MDDVFVRFGITLLVVYVPAKNLKERIYKLPSKLGLIISAEEVGFAVAFKQLNEFKDFFRCGDLLLLSFTGWWL